LDSERKPKTAEVLEQLERLLGSTDFDTSERSRQFLRFVVEEALEGHAADVTQHRIATSVFGRRDDFDPTTDPIVRIQAGRVRRSLEHYYLTGGRFDPVILEIPKGSYVPIFRLGEDAGLRPALLVIPFANLTDDPRYDFIAQGLASDLAIELDRYHELPVFLRGAMEGPETQESPPARFAVDGALSSLEDALKISVWLRDMSTGQQLWGHQYLAWAHLARLYATNYSLELADEETPIDTALSFAETGVRLDPLDQRTRLTKAFVHLVKGDVEAGRLEVESAVHLNPDSLFFLDAVGYLLTLLGDWEQGPELSRKAVRLNPCHRDVVHAGLWLDAVRREDYRTARHEAEAFLQAEFWQPLMRAVSLAHLDELDEASTHVEQLLQWKPAFRDRGRWLIERYVKFDDLIARIERGLAKVGLEIV
jgi:TolB-like protein